MGKNDIIFIDEGQKIPSIGQTIKLLVDRYGSEKQVLVTGSSSIHLLDLTVEPLTGRKIVFQLFPLSYKEMSQETNFLDIRKNLNAFVVYGMYPDVVKRISFEEKGLALRELATSALYKDILEFQMVKNFGVLSNLLRAIALQLGNEVSSRELASLVGIDKNTVDQYIDLLEKSFILFCLPSYFRNKRK